MHHLRAKKCHIITRLCYKPITFQSWNKPDSQFLSYIRNCIIMMHVTTRLQRYHLNNPNSSWWNSVITFIINVEKQSYDKLYRWNMKIKSEFIDCNKNKIYHFVATKSKSSDCHHDDSHHNYSTKIFLENKWSPKILKNNNGIKITANVSCEDITAPRYGIFHTFRHWNENHEPWMLVIFISGIVNPLAARELTR